MELIFIWLLFGVGAAIVARDKGLDGCLWFVLGILLGPVGLLLAFAVRGDPSTLERRAIASGQSKRCPDCAELVRREAIKCRHCGSDLPAIVEEPDRSLSDRLRENEHLVMLIAAVAILAAVIFLISIFA